MTIIPNHGTGRLSRREALKLGAGAGLGIASVLRGNVANAQRTLTPPVNPKFPQPAAWKTEFKQLAPNFWTYILGNGPPASGGGIANTCVAVGTDALTVFDTHSRPGEVEALKEEVRRAIGNKPFNRVVNTHNHGDHVNGNQWFMPAEIVGHPYCRERVLSMAAALGPNGTPDPAYGIINPVWETPGEPPVEKNLIAPTTLVADKVTYHFGSTVVEVFHPGIGHTYGDLLVYLPEHRVLFASDVAFFNVMPAVHNGHATQWIEVCEKVLDMDVVTIIPGHGPAGGKKDMADMLEFWRLLKAEGRKRFDGGMSAARATADIDVGRFINWLGASRMLQSMVRLYAEFDGTLTPFLDRAKMKVATAEYNAILKARG